MIIPPKTLIPFLLNIFIIKEISCRSIFNDEFLFSNLAINKSKLDPSYFYNYDNLEWNGKIIAIGDIHGDMESLQLILKHSNLIDDNDDWNAENVLLIQVGDILDRGIYGPSIYDFLFKLQKQAIKKNSRVILILGNHEQLNLCGRFNYVNKKEIKIFFDNNYMNRLYSFNNKHGYYFKKLIRLPPMVKVNNILFVHAGISEQLRHFNINLINLKTRLQIENKCRKLNFDNYNYLGIDGVLWNDDIYYKIKFEKNGCSHLKKILNKFYANGLIVGHKKQNSHEIVSYCRNNLFLIDTAMSLFMNNGNPYPNYLIIENGKFKSINLNIVYGNKKKCSTFIQLKNLHKKKVCIYTKQTEF